MIADKDTVAAIAAGASSREIEARWTDGLLEDAGGKYLLRPGGTLRARSRTLSRNPPCRRHLRALRYHFSKRPDHKTRPTAGI